MVNKGITVITVCLQGLIRNVINNIEKSEEVRVCQVKKELNILELTKLIISGQRYYRGIDPNRL